MLQEHFVIVVLRSMPVSWRLMMASPGGSRGWMTCSR